MSNMCSILSLGLGMNYQGLYPNGQL